MNRAALIMLLMLVPTVASAQTADEVERAEAHYRAGMTAFQEGDFANAADEFQASYDLVPKPELLYNASFALARAGKVESARQIALDAVATKLPADIDAKFRARLHGWRTVERARTRPAPTPVVAATSEPVTRERPEVIVPAEAPPRIDSGLRVASYITGGLGLTALIAGTVMELQLRAVERQLDDAAARNDRAAYDEKLRSGQQLQNIGRVTLIGGAALVATSVVLWVVSRKKRREAPELVFRF